MKRFLAIFSFSFVCIGLLSKVFPGHVDAQTKPAATPSPTPPSIVTTPSPTPRFKDDEPLKVETELVNLTVRVVDRNNRPINGLKEGDFKILEDGVPQKIDFFSNSDVPTNYGIVLDNSGSLRPQLEKVIEAGKILVNTNRPYDDTMIIRFVGRDKISIEQPFTNKKADLIDALDNLFIEGGQTAIIDAVYLAAEHVEQYEKSKEDRKRRALIVVSDGEDRDSYYNEKQLFDLLRESEVQIYTIGFIGDLSKDGGFIGKSPQGKAKSFLERMATETGGRAYFPADVNELAGIAREISAELRTQYSIGYIPSNDKKDGTYRAIKVQVEEGPNAQKRIAISRTGRTAEGTPSPNSQKPTAVQKNP